jgi:hypothetical protein
MGTDGAVPSSCGECACQSGAEAEGVVERVVFVEENCIGIYAMH